MALTVGVPRAPAVWPMTLRQFTTWIQGAFTEVISGTIEGSLIVDSTVTLPKLAPVATDTLLGRSTAGTGAVETITCTAAGRALLDDAAASNQRTTLGLGTSAVVNTGTSGATIPLLNAANTWALGQTFTAPPILPGYTVATLPAGTAGMRAHVTDAAAPVFLTAVVGGGAVVTPVFYNGTAWVAG